MHNRYFVQKKFIYFKDRVPETPPSSGSLPKWPQWFGLSWAGPGAKTFTYNFQVSGRSPSTWSFLCCLSGCTSRELNWNKNNQDFSQNPSIILALQMTLTFTKQIFKNTQNHLTFELTSTLLKILFLENWNVGPALWSNGISHTCSGSILYRTGPHLILLTANTPRKAGEDN